MVLFVRDSEDFAFFDVLELEDVVGAVVVVVVVVVDVNDDDDELEADVVVFDDVDDDDDVFEDEDDDEDAIVNLRLFSFDGGGLDINDREGNNGKGLAAG